MDAWLFPPLSSPSVSSSSPLVCQPVTPHQPCPSIASHPSFRIWASGFRGAPGVLFTMFTAFDTEGTTPSSFVSHMLFHEFYGFKAWTSSKKTPDQKPVLFLLASMPCLLLASLSSSLTSKAPPPPSRLYHKCSSPLPRSMRGPLSNPPTKQRRHRRISSC